MSQRTITIASSVVALLLLPTHGSAQSTYEESEADATGWLFAGELQGSTPLDAGHDAQLELGGGALAGLYHSLLVPELQLGATLAAGALAAEEGVAGDGIEDEDFGLGMLNAALRVQPFADSDESMAHGLWLEVAGGAGFMDSNLSPTFAPGLGYNFGVAGVSLGPVARYVHAVNNDDSFAGDDLQMATLGLQLAIDDLPVQPQPGQEQPPEMVPASGQLQERSSVQQGTGQTRSANQSPDAAGEGAPTRSEDYVGMGPTPYRSTVDSDGDSITDDRDQCDLQPEEQNGVNDHDGCPDTEVVLFIDSRAVIDETVFFDVESSTLTPLGRAKLDEIVSLYDRYGEQWRTLFVSGHSDQRGPASYNLELSRERAKAVANYLVQQGMPREMINTTAYGEWVPEVEPATTPKQFAQNRRVEFTIAWRE